MSPEDIEYCLVDLHGTCYEIPFQRQGLPYLGFVFIGIFLFIKCLSKIVYQGAVITDQPPHETPPLQLHLFFGRVGLFLVIIGCIIWDNGRIFLASWDLSWPSPIRNASNITVANHIWEHSYHYRGANLQVALTWMALTCQCLLMPLALLGLLQIFYKTASPQLRALISERIASDLAWLGASCLLVLAFMAVGFLIFTLGPARNALVLTRSRSHILTLVPDHDTTFWPFLRFQELVWQFAILALSLHLFLSQQGPRMFRYLFVLLTNVFCVLLQIAALSSYYGGEEEEEHKSAQMMAEMVTGDSARNGGGGGVNYHSWLPALGNFATVLAIGSQLMLDSICYSHDGTDNNEGFDQDGEDEAQEPLLSPEERRAAEGETVV